jgi:hypothetical protein
MDENRARLLRYDKLEYEIRRLKKYIAPYQEKIKTLKQETLSIKSDVCSQIFSNNVEPIIYNLPNSAIGESSALRFSQSERTQTLNQDSLGNILLKYFDKTDPVEFNNMTNAQKATAISNFLGNKDNRNKKLLYTVRRIDYVD